MAVSLYVHIPFCQRKCAYCDFVSFEKSNCDVEAYIDAVLREAQLYSGEKVNTFFLGGGTPSLLSCAQLIRLVEGLKAILDFCKDSSANSFADSSKVESGGNAMCFEATMESNPGSLNTEKLLCLQELGFNRLSIGLQSANNEELALLGRIHTYEEFLHAYQAAQAVFDNINIDLISGIPGQTAAAFANTLQRVVSLRPAHISAYSLIVEPATPLGKKIAMGELVLPDEDCDREIYHQTKSRLAAAGYMQYEISNYARKGKQCRHNLAYWTGLPYIGLGCAAHSYYNGERFENPASLKAYMLGRGPINGHKLTEQEVYEEFIMLRTRLSEGFSLAEFKQQFGYDFYEKKQKEVDFLVSNGCLVVQNGMCKATEYGQDVVDAIILKLI